MEKRLVRKNGVLFGVCGGLGDYFRLDPNLFRIGFLVAIFGFGTGILLYLVMAIIMPSQKNIPNV